MGSARTTGRSESQVGLDLDVAADHLLEQAQGLDGGVVHVDIARLENLAAGEGQQLARERGGPPALLLHFFEMPPQA